MIAGCHRGSSGGSEVAAVVNGDSITNDQYQRYLELKPTVQVVVDPSKLQTGGGGQIPTQPYSGQVVGSLGMQAMTDLVEQALLKQMARDEGVYPTDAQVEAELKDREDRDPNYVRNLIATGSTLEMIRSDIGVYLANFNLTTKGITVSDDELNKYIKEHPADFEQPEQVDLLWMLVRDDKTKALAEADLNKGKPFDTVATQYSISPDKARMGNHFKVQSVPQLAAFGPDLQPAVQKTGDQQQTAWIKFTEGWAKFFVNRKIPKRPITIDDKVKKKLRNILMIQKGSAARDVNARLRQRLKDSATSKPPGIVINAEHLKEQWKTALDTLNAQSNPGPATSTPAPSNPPKPAGR